MIWLLDVNALIRALVSLGVLGTLTRSPFIDNTPGKGQSRRHAKDRRS